ncbi:ROK family protein [Plantibacter sp. YIM 135249]|uniref:ROK family protein n=1 Tax=Plantibacter sp. YIM 135249 TaxID=3423918 RepID=UPI003D33F094
MVTSYEGGTTAWLRARNDRTALRMLIEQGPLTRSQLGRLTGVTKPTATQMLERLQRAGLITLDGMVQNTRGPSAESYRVRADWLTGVAISVTAERVDAVLVDVAGGRHPVATHDRGRDDRAPEEIVRDAIEAACAAADAEAAAVRSVVVGVQAAVADDTDALSLTSGLPGWPERGARNRISGALGIDVVLENDVNLATVAERVAGAGVEPSSFVLLWLGFGIGVGIDLRGEIHRGSNGSAGEIGYLPVSADIGRPDEVDLTDLLGGVAVVDLLGLDDDGDYEAGVVTISQRPDVLNVLADRIVLALEPVQAVLDPAMVVLGGPTGRAGGDALAELVAERIRAAGASDPPRANDPPGSSDQNRPSAQTIPLAPLAPLAPLVVSSRIAENGVLVGGQHVLRALLQEKLEAEIPAE